MFSSTARRLLPKALCAVLLLGTVGGCSTVAFYGQGIIGHGKLMWAREPIDAVLKQAEVTRQIELASNMQLTLELRQFASEQLGLPAEKSYQSYVALKREYPVWNVVATKEFSVDAHQWCYLVIGCASYRGYFNQQSAQRYAEKLQTKGYDISVGGAVAYSTLGWFADPVLPSMFRYGEAAFAEILFHELAHQVVYVKGDSNFNEAFATVVGEQGAIQWLKQHRPDELAEYQARLSAQRDFNRLLLAAREKLASVYSNDVDDEQKRADKAQILARLKQDYDDLKDTRWAGKGWFDNWFQSPVNNARLASVATYFSDVPRFEALLSACDRDIRRFMQRVKKRPGFDKEEDCNA